jgi:hypothetical protein
VTWENSAICRTRPWDWWETGDGGNRLAMTLCRVACPVVADCAQADPAPIGMIRAGVAYSNTGLPLLVCPCGRPIDRQGARRDWCRTCEPPDVRRVHAPTVSAAMGRPALFPCGTWQAYQRHVRHGEPTCDKCREARRLLRQRQRAAERDRRSAVRGQQVAPEAVAA